jgi:hypothetical protein
MIVLLFDADNLSAPACVNEALETLEAGEGIIAVRRAYGSVENLKGLAETLRTCAIRPFVNLSLTELATASDGVLPAELVR